MTQVTKLSQPRNMYMHVLCFACSYHLQHLFEKPHQSSLQYDTTTSQCGILVKNVGLGFGKPRFQILTQLGNPSLVSDSWCLAYFTGLLGGYHWGEITFGTIGKTQDTVIDRLFTILKLHLTVLLKNLATTVKRGFVLVLFIYLF